MKKSATVCVTLLCLLLVTATAQSDKRAQKTSANALPPAEKKYPSLLWEITGNGLKTPSYLFGTMHVSDKLAFHLGDSFYNAIKNVQVVALETNPEHWQEDFSRSVFYRSNGSGMNNAFNTFVDGGMPEDYMQISSFAMDTYEEKIKAALAVEPSMINGMLYRTYGGQQGDFEEDTFLDMYIFQVGKKLGKRLSGVEDFRESEKLVMEAYRDMLRDQHKKRRSYDYESMLTNPKKLEDAYRKGDLDLLDSLESLTVFSEAFQEKFLFRRNEIQAHSIDTILRRQSLFAGVGAAHLPGPRGVIELLRKKGYILRPVKMDDRNSMQKETIEKMNVEKAFSVQTAPDGFFKVAIPGDKFYRFTEWQGMDMVQYADMVNGAYYMVTRIKTNSFFLGHGSEAVYRKIDSLLYENVPGRILKRSVIARNGYKGLDFTNRTRRGDCQRYQVFVTPFEIIVFKMSGNGEFINTGNAAAQFFGSIVLKDYASGQWQTWQPATGGFSVLLPHEPAVLRDNSFGTNRLEYAARDVRDGNSYLVMQSSFHNFSFLEEDTFELALMEESYRYSSFIDRLLDRRFTKVNGYPALEGKYRHKDGSYSSVKYIIRGPVYYAVVARYQKANDNVQRFLQSFSVRPYVYQPAKEWTDTSLHMTVKSPVYAEKKENEGVGDIDDIYRTLLEEESGGAEVGMRFESKLISNDTTGEKIMVSYVRLPKYAWIKDSIGLWEGPYGGFWKTDSSYIYRLKKIHVLPNGMHSRELNITDTGSSRMFRVRSFHKDGHFFSIAALTDTSERQSAFIEEFFSSFRPADTLKGRSVFTRKSDLFFKDLLSADSAVATAARQSLSDMAFDSADVPAIKRVVDSLHWNMSGYLAVKEQLISAAGASKDPSVVPWLKDLYWKVKDTVVLQNAILNALLAQRTLESFTAFRDLIVQEPPIVDHELYDYSAFRPRIYHRYIEMTGEELAPVIDRGSWYPLYDTLALTKKILPDFLQLLHVDDYRESMLNLLVEMVDSGYLKPADYETYFSKIYVDGRQMLKKQLAREDKQKMEEAAKKDRPELLSVMLYDAGDDKQADMGNDELDQYAVLLMPFRDKNPGVQHFFEQLLKSRDRLLVYNTLMLLLRHNQPVPDSLFVKYAALDKYRSELYSDLKKLNKLDRFPARYKTQQDIARSLFIRSATAYDKLDTVAYLGRLPATHRKSKGFVYFFKYKRMPDDVVWNIASIGLQPEKQTEVDVENRDFVSREERKLDNGKPVMPQLQEILKELQHSKRRSASMFYEARTYNLYKNYLSEMVKQQRYRD